MPHPLAEVFGFPITNVGPDATRGRASRLCPYNNKSANCTKDKAKNPLGVCSIFEGESVVITCPVRFRQNWDIATDAAEFFFPKGASWTSLAEVNLKDKNGKSAGNIDVVLVSYNESGKVLDFGSLEVQAVYISGNIRNPFEAYIAAEKNDHEAATHFDWTGQPNYPRADYVSSSRKRLAPQLIFKGGILKEWNRKMAVALNVGFFRSLPDLPVVAREEADMAWFVYDLVRDTSDRFQLTRVETVYTKFKPSLQRITNAEAGDISAFIGVLQEKLDDKLDDEGSTETIALNDVFER